MDLLKRFVEYLSSQKNNVSKATIKNYAADVKQFIRWFENTSSKTFNLNDTTPQLIDVYKTNLSPKLSPRSLERHLSSLRKFFNFLKMEGTIFKDPFETISNSLKNANSKKDKWHLNEFKNYLYVYNAAHLTIKNYIIDIKQFFAWLEQVTGANNAWDIGEKNVLQKLSPVFINEYKERLSQNLSAKTINRKLSSLRKYLAWAEDQKLTKTHSQDLKIKNEKLEGSKNTVISRSVATRDPIHDRRKEGISHLVRNDTTYYRLPPLRLLQKTINAIIFMLDSLLILPFAEAIEEVKYLFWKIKGKPVFKKISNKLSNEQRAKNLIENWKLEIGNYRKAMYAPLTISTRYFPFHKKVWHHTRYTRPKWYRKYHSYTVVHYLHFAILVMSMSAFGFSLYNDLIFKPQNKRVLSSVDAYQPRILEFKGRITDSLDNPIASPNTPLRISLYNHPTATGSSLLWQEVASVSPNKDGVFETTLGKNVSIAQDIFFQNPSLWLGISIGQTVELIPRQELATVAFTVNTQTLQGLPPITQQGAGERNVVLALDSSGNLTIGGSATPVFQATDGQFTLSGKVLLLTTLFGSNTDVTISPDGFGKIDLQKPLQNTSNNNNIASAIGAVEVDDLFAVLATSSAQSAVTVNQDGTGPIISASSSGTAKFTVDNTGNIISAKGANWQPTFDSVNGLSVASASGMPFVTFDTLNRNVGIGTIIPQASLDVLGSFRASGDITLSKFTSNGRILYTNASGVVAQITAGTSTQCLLGGTTPQFGTCSSYNNISESGGNIGIGITIPLFKLDIQDNQAARAAGQIFNTNTGTDADGLVIKLGNTSTSEVNNSNHFISFETSGIGIVGSIRGNSKGVQYQTSGIADFAEYLKKDENQTIEYGSIVCINEKGLVLPCDKDNTNIVGVASENPSFLGGENLGNKSIAVGLVGQVAVRVSALNGPINPGDPLTASDIKGVAVKTINGGQIIGKALEEFTADGIGKILVSVNVSWYDPDVYLTNTGELSIANQEENSSSIIHDSPFIIQDTFGRIVERIGIFSEVIIANLTTGLIKAEEITTNSFSIATESITIAGVSLKDYISQTISQTPNSQLPTPNSNRIISPIAEIDEIHTNIISPLAKDSNISISLRDSQFIIHDSNNASGSAVATIDSSGNASFSGTLKSNQLEVNEDATVGGILRAKRIIADELEGLDQKVATLAAQYQNTQNTQGLGLSDNLISPISSDSPSFLSFPNGNLNASFGTFTLGMMSFGPTSLIETAIAGQLSIQGSLILADNSIDVLGNDLQLQPLRQGGISILAGLITIDENGNLKVQGNAEFAKDVEVKGDLVASGSATFSKINLSLISPALALSQTEIIATGSAGVATIKANRTEVTIINRLVTENSLIYITPVGTPSAQSPFLIRQTVNESFTVGVQTPSQQQEALFNWLIVN